MSNVPMSNPELALAVYEEHHSHNSTFAQLDDGRILRMTLPDYQLMTSEDGGLSWSEGRICHDTNGEQVGGPAFSMAKLSGKNSIGLAAVLPGKWGYTAVTMFWRSDDAGQTWTPPVQMNQPWYPGGPFPNSLIRLESGRLVLPVAAGFGQGGTRASHMPFPGGYMNGQYISTDAHFFDPHFAASYVLYSDDEGQTWKKSQGELFVHVDGLCAYAVEPSVVEVSPNKLLMFVRTKLGRPFQAWSEDAGENWSRLQPTALAASPAPARLAKMPDTGHLLCVWNQAGEEEIRKGYVRTRLSAAISRNGGGVWEFFQNVHSIHEQRWVPPGPIRPTYPEQSFSLAGRPAGQWDTRYVEELPVNWGRWSNVCIEVCADRVLISHSNTYFDEHGSSRKRTGDNYIKVLPFEWFYRGLDRFAENSTLIKVSKMPPPP